MAAFPMTSTPSPSFKDVINNRPLSADFEHASGVENIYQMEHHRLY